MSEKRIIYINTDHNDMQYINEAVISARSFRKYIPEAEYVLYTNHEGYQNDAFDRVFVRDFSVPEVLLKRSYLNGQMKVKLEALVESPARFNLYLGADTLAVHPHAASIFDVLQHFDFAAAHAPLRILKDIPGVPRSFPEFNCDVVAFRNTRKVRSVLKKWSKMYVKDVFGHPHDQGIFRYLMWSQKVRIATLPFEFNNRMGKFGDQVDDKNNRSIIIQNRDIVKEIIEGKRSLDDL